MVTSTDFLSNYSRFKVGDIIGRFFSRPELEKQLEVVKDDFQVREIGRSFLNLPIETVQVGTGSTKVLAWSQMHGNETTTTKGIFDLLNFFTLYDSEPEVKQILQKVTCLIIPMLNPDGAFRYTRENVNGTDLNRDALNLKEPESRVLRECFDYFEPHYCFNLHDQRTIFGAGEEPKPATLSFLAPSMDELRTLTPTRITAMKIIAEVNEALQEIIPNQVGRFDDSFNLNCTGDYFQAQGVPTILFECGHFQEDYLREKTREFFTFSLFTALKAIASESYLKHDVEDYFKIPENRKNFNDIILRNGVVAGAKVDVAIQFSEKMKSGILHFIPFIQNMAPRLSSFGHHEIDCMGGEITGEAGKQLSENDIVEVILLKKEKLIIKPPSIQ